MRYSAIQLTPKRGLTLEEFGEYVGCLQWAKDAIKAGWLQAVHHGKEKRYDIDDADSCFNRFKAGEWPA